MLKMIALWRSNNNTGMIKTDEKVTLLKNVEIVASHISFIVNEFLHSSAICILAASEKPSDMAIAKIPPITTRDESVLECNPTISPSVPIIPEVKPKLKPILIELFTE